MQAVKNQELHFISRLSDYTLRSFLIRLGLVSATAWLFLFLAVTIVGDGSIQVTFIEYIRTILIFNVISEGNVLFDHLAERFLPIPEKFSLRLSLHMVISLVLGGCTLILLRLTGYDALFFAHPIMQLMILFGLIFIFILIVVSVTLRITEKWIFSIRQLEELKNLKLAGDYHSLQAQLNPHFLFNNLSVLKSMITYEPAAAVQFTQNFTDVYRYVLQSKDKTTVSLAEELVFLQAYIALHQERMGQALRVVTDTDDEALNREIPPLALQLLVENAIKHNIALSTTPLVIQIVARGDRVMVTNTLTPKESSFSEKTGLANLMQRYAILTGREVRIEAGDRHFTVEIPLL